MSSSPTVLPKVLPARSSESNEVVSECWVLKICALTAA